MARVADAALEHVVGREGGDHRQVAPRRAEVGERPPRERVRPVLREPVDARRDRAREALVPHAHRPERLGVGDAPLADAAAAGGIARKVARPAHRKLRPVEAVAAHRRVRRVPPRVVPRRGARAAGARVAGRRVGGGGGAVGSGGGKSRSGVVRRPPQPSANASAAVAAVMLMLCVAFALRPGEGVLGIGEAFAIGAAPRCRRSALRVSQ